MTKVLIVNADDYGMSPAVSRGILESHLNGILTSTTVMISTPGAVEDVQEAVKRAPRLGLGLHLVLAGGKFPPVLSPAEVPSLVREDGHFYDQPEWQAHFNEYDADEIRLEFQAQFDLFVKAAGRPPDHLDSHYHAAYRHPIPLRAMFDLAARHKLPIRNPGIDLNNLETTLKTRLGVNELWLPAIRAVYEERTNPPWPAHFDYVGSDSTPDDVDGILSAIPEDIISEMMCHPGYVDEILGTRDTYTSGREAEVTLLTHTRVRELIDQYGVTLSTFSVLQGEA